KIFNIDFDEVSIERVVNRDGTNEYLLNGTQVRLKDILELLAEAHIGVSGHHIISQGEADRILTASEKERREMIEDALGLKIYQYKRKESERKLEKTFENIAQVESLRKEIAPHLRFLKKQVDKMSRATEIKEKLTKLYREYLKREKTYIDGEKVNIKNENDPLLKKEERIKREMEKAREALESSKKKDLKSDELLNIESRLRKEREKKDNLSREAGKLEGEIKTNEALLEKTLKKVEAGENITIALKEVEQLALEIENENEITEIKRKIREFLNNKKGNSEESFLRELQEIVSGLKKKKEEIENKITEVAKEVGNFEESYNQLRALLEKEKDSGRDAEKEMLRLSTEETLLRAQKEVLIEKERRLKLTETNFLIEVEEAGVLLGSAITGFANLEIPLDEILKENRQKQEERRREVERMKIRLEEFGAAGGEETMKEFGETSERDAFLEKELNDLHTSSKSLKHLLAELEERLNMEFKEGIEKINKAFNNFFSLMFGGGTAKLITIENSPPASTREANRAGKLKIENSNEDLEAEENEKNIEQSGIDIDVSLPKKRIRGLTMLSGGERALTSIALLFAMSQVNPPPFIILDETDAALDEANSKKYGDMIESLSKHSQLILITHNRETMSRAGVIYGVTMGSSGVSRLLSIAFDEAVAVVK
ncbi:MAG: hypothetical protein AAB861_02150, partial [Patescibacteria group bacterium]